MSTTLAWMTSRRSWLAPWLVLAIAWCCLALGMVLRRASGSLSRPLGWVELVGAAALALAVSAVLRTGVSYLFHHRTRRLDHLVFAATVVIGIAVLGSATVEGTSHVAVVLSWGLFTAVEAIWGTRLASAHRSVNRMGASRLPDSSQRPPRARAMTTPDDVAFDSQRNLLQLESERGDLEAPADDVEEEDESLDENIEQQWTRSRTPTEDSLSGLLRVRFAVGERAKTVHIPFYPSFERTPRVSVEQIEGAELSWQIAQVETFGVRLETRRKGNEVQDESTVLHVQVIALRP